MSPLLSSCPRSSYYWLISFYVSIILFIKSDLSRQLKKNNQTINNNGCNILDANSVKALGLINRINFVMIAVMTAIIVAIRLTTEVKEVNKVKAHYISLFIGVKRSPSSVCILEFQKLVMIQNKLVTWGSVKCFLSYHTYCMSTIMTQIRVCTYNTFYSLIMKTKLPTKWT